MTTHTPGPTTDERRAAMVAEARLIAAAPDLLAALKAAYEELRTHIGGDVTVQVSEAIAKAEGTQS